jgi:hypothetical protein
VKVISSAHEALFSGTQTFYLWESNATNLGDMVTTKADRKRGLSKVPRKETAKNYSTVPLAISV